MSHCQRCEQPSVLVTRNQNFCQECFIKFIRGKQRKMMQTLNSNNMDRLIDILLPINYDLSNTSYVNFSNSITLLDILINYSKDLYKLPFKITVLFIVDSDDSTIIANIKQFFKNIKETYKFHDIDLKILNLLTFVRLNQNLYNINIDKNCAFVNPTQNKFNSFSDYINSVSSKSTKEDFLFNIYWTLIKVYAYLHEFPVVLFSNSMNNVATKILSNIIKGKGIEISQVLDEEQDLNLADGQTFKFRVLYPLKDVFNNEVVNYIDLLNLTSYLPETLKADYEKINHKDTGINNKIMNVKGATLNQLVNDYFNDLEKNGYSTIVSTVVSTGMRLTLPKTQAGNCPLCKFKTSNSATEWLNNITVNTSCDEADKESEIREAARQTASAASENKKPLNICYGCLVSFGTLDEEFSWPINVGPSSADKAILDEFTISDDEDEDEQ